MVGRVTTIVRQRLGTGTVLLFSNLHPLVPVHTIAVAIIVHNSSLFGVGRTGGGRNEKIISPETFPTAHVVRNNCGPFVVCPGGSRGSARCGTEGCCAVVFTKTKRK